MASERAVYPLDDERRGKRAPNGSAQGNGNGNGEKAPTAFGAFLARQLSEKRLRASDFSRSTGISESAISSWIAGTRNPSTQHINVIADGLEVQPSVVLRALGIRADTAASQRPEDLLKAAMDDEMLVTLPDEMIAQLTLTAWQNYQKLVALMTERAAEQYERVQKLTAGKDAPSPIDEPSPDDAA